jgi:hypothetical protein
MKNIFYITMLLFLAVSCSSNKSEDPLILPPNFAEIPDLTNPEIPQEPTAKQKEENIAKLKELLLKSDE